MNIRKIHRFFVPGRIPLILLILFFILIRLLQAEEKDSLEFWGLIVMQLGIAFLLLYLNRTFVIIRNRTLLSTFFYLIFTGVNPMYHCTWISGIASFCILIFFILLFLPSLQSYPQGNAFNIAFILTLGSFIWQPLLFFFPVLWFGLSNFHGLNFRSFFAGLTGFALPYLFIFTGSIYLNDNVDIFLERLPDFQILFQFHFLEGFTHKEYVITGTLLILFILSGINIFVWNISENTRTIISLSFLYIITLFVFAMLLLQPQWKNEWFSILCLSLSLLVSHLFSRPYQRIIIWIMLLTLVFFLATPWFEG